MNNIFKTYRPEGFGTLSSYLMVEDPSTYISFLQNAFYAEELDCTRHPETGLIRNCILKIGDSCLMVAPEQGDMNKMRTSHYLYVDDPDKMFERALEYGATPIFPPADMDYNDRQGGVIDPAGNYWWISKRLVHKGYHEE